LEKREHHLLVGSWGQVVLGKLVADDQFIELAEVALPGLESLE
jgi:hypothetical protein